MCATTKVYKESTDSGFFLSELWLKVAQTQVSACLVSYFFVCFGLITCEKYYIVPSQGSPCCVDHCFTLSQFVDNFANCSNCDNSVLIFAPGNYSFEARLIVKDVHSFSMFAGLFSSTTQIICDLDATFEFVNVGTVVMNGLGFIECFGNELESVTQFQLTNSTFYSHPEANGTMLTISKSTAYLDRVSFLSIDETAPDHTLTSLQSQENCTLDASRILTVDSLAIITQGLFDRSVLGAGAVISSLGGSKITIVNSTFRNNRATCCYLNTGINVTYCTGAIMRINQSVIDIYDSRFEYNQGHIVKIYGGNASFTHIEFSNHFTFLCQNYLNGSVIYVDNCSLRISYSTFTNNTIPILVASYSNISISSSKFVDNKGRLRITGGQVSIEHSTFVRNTVPELLYFILTIDVNVISLCHNEFVNNTATVGLISFNAGKILAIKINNFIGNKVDGPVVVIVRPSTRWTIVGNLFMDNYALYDIYVNPNCKSGLSLSLGTSRCIECPKHWYRNLIGILVAASVAGILLVVFMLALNLTVAVGTLNGILFYASIVASNVDAYFPLSSAPNFATVFVSWINVNVGFDICIYEGMAMDVKAMLQFAFPAYVILLVVVSIVFCEYSSKFSRIVGKGNPVAVLATMVLISNANLFKAVIGFISLSYLQPAYGSLNFNPTRSVQYRHYVHYTIVYYAWIAVSSLIFCLGFLYTILVFVWQWLIRYQNKTIFKWVRYQKLHHFMEPYHAPYSTKYRYWTGLLLIIRIILFSVSTLNFTRDPRVDFVSTIFVIGCLLLFKGVVAKRIYTNVVIDVMETGIYFNLVFFAAFSWYSLDFGGNQVAVAYISVVMIFVLLLAVIIFHILRFTCFYKLSFIQLLIKWIASKLTGKKVARENLDEDRSDEVVGLLHGARPRRVTYSVVGISKNETGTAL